MRYPIGKVFMETELVVARINQEEASRAVLIQKAMASVLSKKGAASFSKRIEKMSKS